MLIGLALKSFFFIFLTVRTPEGQIKLYSKGADTIIFDRLDPSSEDLMYTTSEHLSVGVV